MSSNRLGVFGGTFNPPHLGHLILVHDAMEQFDLSQVLFIPSATPAHKRCPDLAPAHQRMEMVEASLVGEINLSTSDIEIARGGTSYAIDTVRELSVAYPESDVKFIIGADSLMELHMWKDLYELLKLCEFVVLERPGYRLDDLKRQDLKLEPPWTEKLLANVATGHMVSVSSTDIRRRIAEGMQIRHLVHPSVAMYIAEHSLYTS